MRVTWPKSSSKVGSSSKNSGRERRNSRPPEDHVPKRASTPQHKREGKIQAVQQSKRKEKLKNKKTNSVVPVRYPYIFVGNLKSSITEERLQTLFAHCGTIYRIEIRCSRGKAITVGVPVPEDLLTSRDRQYASIEFTNTKATRLALRLDGTQVDGCQIVVARAPGELPEVQDIVMGRLGKLHERRDVRRAIPREDTLVAMDTPSSDRHKFLGISFAKCVV